MEVQEAMTSSKFTGVKMATIVTGIIGMVLWGCAIGFSIGYVIVENHFHTNILSIVLILVNVGYTRYTSRIIYSVTSVTFPSAVDFRDVRESSSKLFAAAIPGIAVWTVALIWFIKNPVEATGHEYSVIFGCSFSVIWTIIVSIVASVYEVQISRSYFGLDEKIPRDTRRRNPLTSFEREGQTHSDTADKGDSYTLNGSAYHIKRPKSYKPNYNSDTHSDTEFHHSENPPYPHVLSDDSQLY